MALASGPTSTEGGADAGRSGPAFVMGPDSLGGRERGGERWQAMEVERGWAARPQPRFRSCASAAGPPPRLVRAARGGYGRADATTMQSGEAPRMFKGYFCALITPFREGGVDESAFQSMIEWQIAEGVHGLVPCGTTGESPTLSHAEHERVIEMCVESVAGTHPGGGRRRQQFDRGDDRPRAPCRARRRRRRAGGDARTTTSRARRACTGTSRRSTTPSAFPS